MTWPANQDSPRRHVFLVEADQGADVLMRVLSPFALLGARITGLGLTSGGDRMDLRIEVELDGGIAGQLGRRLNALPAVRGVGVGWTSV